MDIFQTFVPDLVAEFVVTVVGVVVAHYLVAWLNRRLYGGWKIVVVKGGEQKVQRTITPQKARMLQEDEDELAAILKRNASPFGWINEDILARGQEIGLLHIDPASRTYTVNMDNNPPAEGDARPSRG